ncbi:MAG: roadblock/LC7 domain-containing protein [Kineosporiaceae bacterium]
MTDRHPAPSGGRPRVRSLSPAAVAVGPDALAGHAWLVESFVRRTTGVTHAVVTSADGLVLAASSREPADRSDQLAALAAGLTSLAHAAARVVGVDGPLQATVELGAAVVVVRPLGSPPGGTLLALSRADADPGEVGYGLTVLARRVGRMLRDGLDDGPRPPASVSPLR